MTVNRGPGVAKNGALGVTTLEHRLQLAGQYAENAPGMPRSGVLAQATDLLVVGKPTMSYDIGPAPLVISRTAGEGVYTPTLTGTTNVGTDSAPGSGSRWDLIWVKQNDMAKGDADNLAIVGVTKGVSDAVPSKPYGTVPAGASILAEAQIFATTTGTSGGSNTITQVWRHTATRGAPITVRNAAERGEITAPAQGQIINRLDTGRCERWNGTAWRVPSSLRIGKNRQAAVTTAGTSYATICAVTATSTGGPAEVSYTGVLVNGNSGGNKTSDVQILRDGVPVSGITYELVYIPSVQAAYTVAFSFDTTASEGAHTWELQTRGSVISSVVNQEMTLTITEHP